jgi:hypothetical protein
LGVSQNIIVPEAKHAKPFTSEIIVPDYIVLIVCVLAAIDLNDQLSSEACKVDDISADRKLSLELEAVEAMSA